MSELSTRVTPAPTPKTLNADEYRALTGEDPKLDGADKLALRLTTPEEREAAGITIGAASLSDLTQRLTDSVLAEDTARVLGPQLCWAEGRGWLNYNAGRWMEIPEPVSLEMVRRHLRDGYDRLSRLVTSPEDAKKIGGLLSKSKITAVHLLLRGQLVRRADEFDQEPDLLNVANGTVHLPTGTLGPHNPADLLTKITPVQYREGATHEDWTATLRALPEDTHDWFQVRVGQAATGYMTSDDVLPVLQGNGSNGKSTVVAGIMAALGEHAGAVPERVLLASNTDHPTELTTLMGARFSLIEELPEGHQLSTKRLKDVLGTPRMTARKIRQDNVSWNATHSLFLTTNYRPAVNETDHGTWRRLALVTFPYTFRAPGVPLSNPEDRAGDPELRSRMADGVGGQLEAVLAWVIEGARSWYELEKRQLELPAQVVADTFAWRAETDLILGFLHSELEPDGGSAILGTELYEAFSIWLAAAGHRAWTEKTFSMRLEAHDEAARFKIKKARPKVLDLSTLSRPGWFNHSTVPQRPIIWEGVKFRGI